MREKQQARISLLKDYKNWFSLTRLVFGIAHSLLQLATIREEESALAVRYHDRILRVRAASAAVSPVGSSGLIWG